MITVLVARDGTAEQVPLARLPEALADRGAAVWVDMEDAGAEGFEALKPALSFHPLAVEDCVTDVNFPKVDDFGEYLYLAVHSARWEASEQQPTMRELDVLIGPRYLLTYHEGPMRSITRARELLERRPALLARGPDHLLHFMLDVMVDNYLPIVDQLEHTMDELQAAVFKRTGQRLLMEVLRLKHGVATMRRIVGPQRDTILALTREEFTGIRAEMRPYLRDVFDRMARVNDMLDTFRDELSTLMEIYATQVSNRLNAVMRVLTVITVVLMPMNLIAGIYGMNFAMPEQRLPFPFGYLWALFLMAVVGVAMYVFIRSRRWL